MSSGERPMGAAKGKQSDTEALCQPPPEGGREGGSPEAIAWPGWVRAGTSWAVGIAQVPNPRSASQAHDCEALGGGAVPVCTPGPAVCIGGGHQEVVLALQRTPSLSAFVVVAGAALGPDLWVALRERSARSGPTHRLSPA